jgi:hypothetical protein
MLLPRPCSCSLTSEVIFNYHHAATTGAGSAKVTADENTEMCDYHADAVTTR